MASRYGGSWNPAIPRAYDMLPPLPGEAISSWLIRCAILRNCSVAKILSRIGVTWKKPVYWLDFDANALPWDILGGATSSSPQLIKQRIPDRSNLLLSLTLLGLHADPLRRKPHLRYCENCLASDPIPYYRIDWRLSSTWICLRHGSVMRDYCPICQTPIYWNFGSHNLIKNSNLRICYHCGGDLCSIQESTYLPTWLTLELTSIQLEFAFLLGLNEGDDHNHLILATPAENSDAINNTPSAATLSMQSFLRKKYAQQPSPTHSQAFNKLKETVRIVDFSRPTQTPGPFIGVGIEAKNLFGRASAHISSIIMGNQNLFGTTLWWSGERLFINALQHEWTTEDFNLTKNWALRLCDNSEEVSNSLRG